MSDIEKIESETAKKIMKWKLVSISSQGAWIPASETLKTLTSFWYTSHWRPTSDLDHAFLLIQKIGQWRGLEFYIRRRNPDLIWEVGWIAQRHEREWHAEHESLPMAICLAALKTVKADA